MSSPSSLLKHFTLQASAGSGKTRFLIEEIFKVFSSHLQSQNSIHQIKDPIPRIVATTFTNKATQEVKERLMKKAIEEKKWPLLYWINDPSKIIVSTLHKLLHIFLKSHFEKWSEDITFMNNSDRNFLARSVVRNILKENKNHLKLLEYFQFSDIVSMLLKYEIQIRSNPLIKPLSYKEVKDHWDQEKKIIEEKASKLNQEVYQQIKKLNSDLSNFQSLRQEFPQEIRDQLEKMIKCHPKNLCYVKDFFQSFFEIGELFKTQFQKRKEEQGMQYIEDLELDTLEIIRSRPHLIESFSKKWDFWFIDEYQDISPRQEEIICHLYRSAKKVWAVGDPKQSIYFFRGSDPGVFERRKKLKNSKLIHQLQNYRSSAGLVYFFNDLFKDQAQEMECVKEDICSKEPVVCILDHLKSDLNSAIAGRVHKLTKQESELGNIGILLRKNSEVLKIGNFLKSLKFPVQIHSRHGLQREVIDALFCLRFLINPFDNENLIGLLRTPYFYIPDEILAQMTDKKEALWKILSQEYSKHPVVQSLENLIQKSEAQGYAQALDECFVRHSMIDRSFFIDPTQKSEKNLWSLLAEIKKEEGNPHFKHLKFFKDKFYEDSSIHPDESSSQTEAVQPHFIQIMTIHQSKGLEFNHVIIPNINEDFRSNKSDRLVFHPPTQRWSFSIQDDEGETLQPLQQNQWKGQKSDEELQEWDRLFYVATTRAKKSLTLTFSLKGNKKKPSPKSWMGRLDYFEKVQKCFFDLNQDQFVKKIQIHPHYSIEIEKYFKKDVQYNSKHLFSTTPVEPYSLKSSPSKKEDLKFQTPDIPNNIHTLMGSARGLLLHELMYKLSKNQNIDSMIENLSDKEKSLWKEALEYTLNLEKPPIKTLLSQGHCEWDCMHKDQDQQVSVRIDLWGEFENYLWIVDYKSTQNKISKYVWDQLSRYGSIMNKKYPEKQILLCALQPFAKTCEIKNWSIPSNLN